MNKDKQNLLEARKHQLANMSEMVDELRDENESLKRDNFLLSEARKKLLVEEETLDMRLNSVLK
jgi:cell division protein FtsB